MPNLDIASRSPGGFCSAAEQAYALAQPHTSVGVCTDGSLTWPIHVIAFHGVGTKGMQTCGLAHYDLPVSPMLVLVSCAALQPQAANLLICRWPHLKFIMLMPLRMTASLRAANRRWHKWGNMVAAMDVCSIQGATHSATEKSASHYAQSRCTCIMAGYMYHSGCRSCCWLERRKLGRCDHKQGGQLCRQL